MRTRLALLLTVTIGLVYGASALMTSHFGMREWPAAPAPETATRVITPSEGAGRAATDRDDPAERAERTRADDPREDDAAPAATTPVRDRAERTVRRAPTRRGGAAADSPSTPSAPEQPAEQPEPTAAEPIPAPPAAPVDAPHTRDDVVAPDASAPAPSLSFEALP